MVEEIKHSNRKHALLSASGSTRWMECTPSARLEELFPEKASIYAEEGTLAHEYAEILISHSLQIISDKVFKTEMAKVKKNKLFSSEMESEIDKYICFVFEAFSKAKSKTPDASISIEERLDFSEYVENGFGTGDVKIVADGILDIIDLKYGKGVKVDALDNSQMKLYGLGALRSCEMMYDIETIRMTIVQPRLNHISTYEMSVEDLKKWGEDFVKPKAKAAYIGEGQQIPGSWCRFCKAKPVCRALSEESMRMVEFDFKDPYLLSDKEVLENYKKIPVLQDWTNAINSYVLDEALKGKKWEGYKLVEGKSNRKWTDEKGVFKILKENSFKKKEYTKESLLGIPAIEKLIGKEKFQDQFKDCFVKPPGAPALVDENDTRPALGLEQAKIDFKD